MASWRLVGGYERWAEGGCVPELVGTTLGTCRIVRRIGSGGMGDVYLAEQHALAREVVVKVLRDARAGESSAHTVAHAARQFIQEARAIAALDHPHILPLYDYGEQDGIQYLIMPYVPGGSLADLLAPGARHRLDLPLASHVSTEIIRQAATALQFAHDQGFIHRDVKPGNLLIRWLAAPPDSHSPDFSHDALEDEQAIHVLLADFGLARSLAELTGNTATTGTPLYTSPEQYRGKPVPATDQYALGCVAYLLLSGRTVFEGTVAELHHQHLSVEPIPVTQLNPLLPPAVGAVLQRALRKEPEERYPRISDFATALSSASNPFVHTNRPYWIGPTPQTTFGLGVRVPALDVPTPGLTPDSALAQVPLATQPMHPANMQNIKWSVGSGSLATAVASATEPSIQTPGAPATVADSARADHIAARRSAVSAPLFGAAGMRGAYLDAPGAPIPRRRFWLGGASHLPKVRPLTLLVLVVVLAAVLVSGLALGIGRESPISTGADSQHAAIIRAGSVDLRQVPHAQGSVPASQSTLSTRLRLADVYTAGEVTPTTRMAALPAMAPMASWPQATPTSRADTVFREQARFPGLRQVQVGPLAPIDSAIGANGRDVIEAVDGAMTIVTLPQGPHTLTLRAVDFFAPVFRPEDTLGQPRILFDQGSQHWIVAINELRVSGTAVTAGYFDLAVSATAEPVGRWFVAQFSTQTAMTDGLASSCDWADYPQIGRSAGAVYLTGNRFACGVSGAFLGAVLFVLPEQRFLNGEIPIGATVSAVTGFNNAAHQPVFTLTPAQESRSDAIEWLMSDDAGYADNGHVTHQIIVWAVTNTPEMRAGAAPVVVGRVVTLPSPYADPPAVLGGAGSARPGRLDARVTDVRFVQGHLYAAFVTAVNWSTDHQTRSGVYWLDLMPALQKVQQSAVPWSMSVSLVQSGIFGLGGASVSEPVLLADSAGDLVLAAAIVTPEVSAGFVIASHRRDDPPGALGGVNEWYIYPGEAGAASPTWGGYLGGCVQTPGGGDPAVFWVAGAYTTSGASRWQTLVTGLSFRGS